MEYKDLSRRALIKLNNNFDKENDGILHNYLDDHQEDYEKARPVEALIEKVDDTKSAIASRSKSVVNQLLSRELDKVMNNVLEALEQASKLS